MTTTPQPPDHIDDASKKVEERQPEKDWEKELRDNMLTRWGGACIPGNHEYDELVAFIARQIEQAKRETAEEISSLIYDETLLEDLPSNLLMKIESRYSPRQKGGRNERSSV